MLPRSSRLFSLAIGLGSLLGLGTRSYGRSTEPQKPELPHLPAIDPIGPRGRGLTRKQRKEMEQLQKRISARTLREERLDAFVLSGWEAKARKVRAGHASHQWIHPATPSQIALRAQH